MFPPISHAGDVVAFTLAPLPQQLASASSLAALTALSAIAAAKPPPAAMAASALRGSREGGRSKRGCRNGVRGAVETEAVADATTTSVAATAAAALSNVDLGRPVRAAHAPPIRACGGGATCSSGVVSGSVECGSGGGGGGGGVNRGSR